MNRLAILGGGSWGTALALALAPNWNQVRVWMHDATLAAETEQSRRNSRYLPGFSLPQNVRVTAQASDCLEGADVVLICIPSAHVAHTLRAWSTRIPTNSLVVSATKGLEPDTMRRMTEVIAISAGVEPGKVFALSGPSFACDVARNLPTAVVIAGQIEGARFLQQAFSRPALRLYTSEDLIGIEIGGALKNVVAIGSGMAVGFGLGHNAVAALITRGLAEITRLAVRMGADARTLSGLAGLGDLVLTCTGEPSRNRRLGFELAQSVSVTGVLSRTTMTTEGVRTAGVAAELGSKFGVDLPIARAVNDVLASILSPATAMRRLMDRSLREE